VHASQPCIPRTSYQTVVSVPELAHRSAQPWRMLPAFAILLLSLIVIQPQVIHPATTIVERPRLARHVLEIHESGAYLQYSLYTLIFNHDA
jgi:hypothetical protein